MIELKILSIIAVVYINNEEKSKDKIDVCLNRSYFLINKCKNITLATFIACKLSTNSHIQAYYKYVLLEEIKSYLLDNLKKSESKLSMKNVQFSTVILYNQLVDLFKIEIYDSTCSQIEYFDILKNNIATDKATENFLSIGENILSIRKNILHLWEKMIELNPFDLEAERDYNIYLDIILQDDFLKKEEKKNIMIKKINIIMKKIIYILICIIKTKAPFYYVMDIQEMEKYFIILQILLIYLDSLEKKFRIFQ